MTSTHPISPTPVPDFRLGIVHPMAFPRALADRDTLLKGISAIANDHAFDVIELTHIPDPAWRREVTAVLAASRLSVVYAAQPLIFAANLDLSAASRSERLRATDRLRSAIDEGASLGATRLALVSGPAVEPSLHDTSTDHLVSSLVELCRHAHDAGMDVVLETFDTDIDKRRLVGGNAAAARLTDRVRESCHNFGLLLDLSHIPLQHETTDEAITAVRGRLSHAHIGNCLLSPTDDPAYGDHHPHFGYPNGENDAPELARFIRGLSEIGYLTPDGQGVVSFEVKPRPGQDELAVIAGSKRTLRRALAMLDTLSHHSSSLSRQSTP